MTVETTLQQMFNSSITCNFPLMTEQLMCRSAKPIRLGANPVQWSIYGAVYVSIGRINCVSMHAVELSLL